MRKIDSKRSSSDPALREQPPNDQPASRQGDETPIVTSSDKPFSTSSPPLTPTPQQLSQSVFPPDTPVPSAFDPRRESLTSSRPAPPSPAASRRTSAALSRHSSTARSRRQSKATSLSQQTDSQKHASLSARLSLNRRSWIVKIRDFAFAKSDERHIGKGPDVPRPNRPRHRTSILSVSSSSSSTPGDAEDDLEDEHRQQGWGPFRWNTLSSHFWGTDTREGNTGQAGPSRSDFERNFDTSSSSPVEEPGGDGFDSNAQEEEDYEEGWDGGTGINEDEPLLPGIYRALYPFEPEGTAEMALEEEQIVRVVGRGGGVGWAIVEQEGGGHALVPESYLELLEADQD